MRLVHLLYEGGRKGADGHGITGREVVDQIASTKTGAQDRPVEEQKMKKVTVEE